MKSIKKIMLNSDLKNIFEKFLKPCSYTGTCCFDFKIENKKMYVFEMNPRVNGALNSSWNKDNLAEVIRELIQNFNNDIF
jgi:predicted ATP-grasp superfamily ATP-dependent carboligase